MHELAITDSLVDCVLENAGDSRVLKVVVEIGANSGVVPEAIASCFEVCAKGTTLEGATLSIVRTGGRELRIREVEVI